MHPYATLAYANTQKHIGQPLYVPAWRTHVIVRSGDAQVRDAVGPYPLACLAQESDLVRGLEWLRDAGMVSVVLVVDTLTGPPLASFKEAFPITRIFKPHYLVDPDAGAYAPSKHHCYELRRADRRKVETRPTPLREILGQWTALYDELIARHRVTGIQRFSRESFEALADCEGVSAVGAFIDGELCSCHIWVQWRGRVWSHLAATNALGYANGAAYAVYDWSIRHYSGQLINLGGAAGIGSAEDDGLAKFKAGFANRQHPSHLCGAILDAATYHALCAERGIRESDYFPAYRAPAASERTGDASAC